MGKTGEMLRSAFDILLIESLLFERKCRLVLSVCLFVSLPVVLTSPLKGMHVLLMWVHCTCITAGRECKVDIVTMVPVATSAVLSTLTGGKSKKAVGGTPDGHYSTKKNNE